MFFSDDVRRSREDLGDIVGMLRGCLRIVLGRFRVKLR